MDEIERLINELAMAARKCERVFGGYVSATPTMMANATAEAEIAKQALLDAVQIRISHTVQEGTPMCATCRFYREDTCRRRPPTLFKEGEKTVCWFPFVAPRDWCGEHAPKAAP